MRSNQPTGPSTPRTARTSRPRRLLVTACATLTLTGLGLAVSTDAARERFTSRSEVAIFLDSTRDHEIPFPGEVPAIEPTLLEEAAAAEARFAPSPGQAAQQARLEALDQIRRTHVDSLMAEDSIAGVGITRDPETKDWDLLVIAAEGYALEEAARALDQLGLRGDLGSFGLQIESSLRPQLTTNPWLAPGEGRVWHPHGGTTCALGTMGWLARSQSNDEVDQYGSSTGSPSVGYLTALHVTSAGQNTDWEEVATVPRSISWSRNTQCTNLPTGRTVRLGPNAPGNTFADISQDIDYVALERETACDQGEIYQEEGLPVCDDFALFTGGTHFINQPIEVSESWDLMDNEAQMCGGTTGAARSGTIDAIHLNLELQVYDTNGNVVTDVNGDPETVTLKNTWRIVNDAADPDFGVPGDSGGPVWAYDHRPYNVAGDPSWRPLGVLAATATASSGLEKYAFATHLDSNLDDLDVEIIFDSPYHEEVEECQGCLSDCECESERIGLGAKDGINLLSTARETAAREVRRLTRLVLANEAELRGLEKAEGVEEITDLFARRIAPLVRSAYNRASERPRITRQDVQAAQEILAWTHHSLKSEALKAETGRLYRFLAAYGEGRTVQEALRLYLRGTSDTRG